jgi:hypothetical protein
MREIRRHTRTQSQFLRLRRTKIGLRDFRTVKVIGKGAFGEVSTCCLTLPGVFFFDTLVFRRLGGRIRVVFSFCADLRTCSSFEYRKPILLWSIFRRPLRVSLLGCVGVS